MSKLLEGIKVLDLSRVLAGPWCTQVLSDLGAEVTKIESPQGDETKSWGPPFADGFSAYYQCANVDKSVHIVDFSDSAQLVALKQKIHQYDVLVENFKVGGLSKYGLDYASLKNDHPKLIYASIHGFAEGSCYESLPGYDALIQAMSGLMSITGTPEKPVKVGVAISDLLTGMYLSTGISAALFRRSIENKSIHIEVNLMDVQLTALANQRTAFNLTQKNPQRLTTGHPQIVPYQVFNTKTKSMMICIGNDKQFQSFCSALGQSWHLNERFKTNQQRVLHREELVSLIAKDFQAKSFEELKAQFKGQGFPFGPLNDLSDVAEDPYVKESQLMYARPGDPIRILS